MHKRATTTAAAGTNGNGHSPSTPLPMTKQRRRKKRKQKGSHMVEEWMAVILGIILVLGCGYWVFSKLWTQLLSDGVGGSNHGGGKGGGDDEDPDHKHNGHRHKEGPSPMNKLKPVAFNTIYHIPESHKLVGDRTDRYAELRKDWDDKLPKDFARSMEYVQSLREAQVANDYNVVPIVQFESHASLHQKNDRHRHHRRRHMEGGEEEEDEEEEKEEEEQEEKSEAKLVKEEVYDIYNCPDQPVDGYPYAWPIMTLLDNWGPDDTTVPDVIYQGLCVFDFQKDFKKAMTYRKAEVPFITQNDPEVARAVERWNQPTYMEEMLKGVKHRTEFSKNNHFMYHLPPKNKKGKNKHGNMFAKTPKDYVPPTEMLRMPYLEWLEHANVTSDNDDEAEDDVTGPDKDHWYFRLIGCGLTGPDGSCDKGSSEYLYDELPFFQPVDNLYLADGGQQKGIHCRFGMKGVIAETHFDGSRNAIALLGGSRRYIMAHPDQCEALQLYPQGHPSARHSQVDYTNPDLEKFPDFAKANSNEVIMQPGDVLYLPTNWFHYIVSLELNFQCNTRSGINYDYEDVINDCGF